MAELQSKPRESNEGTPHCPYCRDTLEEGLIVQCDQCQALYHKECASSCVILGCAGSLKEASSELRSKLIVRERGAVANNQAAPQVEKSDTQDISAGLFLLVFLALFCVITMAAMGDAAPFVIAVLFGLLVFGLLFTLVVGWALPMGKKDPDKKPPSEGSS